jgi:hypothetical protein
MYPNSWRGALLFAGVIQPPEQVEPYCAQAADTVRSSFVIEGETTSAIEVAGQRLLSARIARAKMTSTWIAGPMR